MAEGKPRIQYLAAWISGAAAIRLGNLGRLLCLEGKTDEGKQCLQRSLSIFQIRYGDDHPNVLEAKRRLEEIDSPPQTEKE